MLRGLLDEVLVPLDSLFFAIVLSVLGLLFLELLCAHAERFIGLRGSANDDQVEVEFVVPVLRRVARDGVVRRRNQGDHRVERIAVAAVVGVSQDDIVDAHGDADAEVHDAPRSRIGPAGAHDRALSELVSLGGGERGKDQGATKSLE